jgi:hypothetical protein
MNESKKYEHTDLLDKYRVEIYEIMMKYGNRFCYEDYIKSREKDISNENYFKNKSKPIRIEESDELIKKYISKKAVKKSSDPDTIEYEQYKLLQEEHIINQNNDFLQMLEDMKNEYHYEGINIIPLIKAIDVKKQYNFEDIIDLFQTTLGKNLENKSNIINVLSDKYFDHKFEYYSIKTKVIEDKSVI